MLCRDHGWTLSGSDAGLELKWFAQDADPIYDDPSIVCPAIGYVLAIELEMSGDVPAGTIAVDGPRKLPPETPPLR